MKSGNLAVIGALLGIVLCVIGYHTIAGALSFTNAMIGVGIYSQDMPSQSLTPVFAVFGMGVLASCFGFIGLILERSSKKIASLEYVIVGIFVLFGGAFIFGVIPAIFFFVAGYLAYQDDKKIQKEIAEEEYLQQSQMQCPYCKSKIPKEASKCSFCGEWVNQNMER